MPHSTFTRPIQLRWSDLDPNNHVRHSVYYDWGAAARIDFFKEHGITPEQMAEHHIGPILFREEAVFRREIRYGDSYTIDLVVSRLRRNFSRFSMVHRIVRRSDTQVCAVITIDGAWIDTQARKLVTPPDFIARLFENAPFSEEFVWE